ncbi:type III secretion system translocon protein SseD [Paraburkholderia sp. RL17-373-BIF-A]|uniref:hypothetical protein n=1 Tax=Paraburkholderia sp. RL17-373-BIF-A TaxID=3031629 RepID=UPI0038B7BECB
MNDKVQSVGASSAPVLSVADLRGDEAIVMINQLMVSLGQLFGKLRDILRQYNQTQQLNTFQMQVTALQSQMSAIDKEFNGKNAQAWAQIAGGIAQTLGGAAGCKLMPVTDISRGLASGIEGYVSVNTANQSIRESQEEQAIGGYQHNFADQLLKRSDETLSNALKVSSELRELLSALVQVHDRMTSSVRM